MYLPRNKNTTIRGFSAYATGRHTVRTSQLATQPPPLL